MSKKIHLCLLFSAVTLAACSTDDRPRWQVVCSDAEGDNAEAICQPQLQDKEHTLTLLKRDQGWALRIAQEGDLGHISADLTAQVSRTQTLQFSAHRTADSCWFRACEIALTDEQLHALSKAKTFTVEMMRIRITSRNARHIEGSEEFTTRGLRRAVTRAN